MSALNIRSYNTYVDEDFSVKDVSEEFVGRKGFSLFNLRDMDVPVPRFFVISGKVFSKYVSDNAGPQLTNKTTSDKIQRLILSGKFNSSIEKEIKLGYSRVSGFSSAWVAVRPSIILPKTHSKLTFAGQLDTVLNVRGFDNVINAIRSVYSNTFTSEVATYLLSNGLSISDIKVAIVIQKMIQSEVSGVAFTTDPITQNPNIMEVEAVFGLGDVISNGEIIPDQYTINKETLKFEDKKIVPQKWMVIRRFNNAPGESGKQKVDISPLWQSKQKLDNNFIEELVKIGMQIEKKEKCSQDIEWVFEGGHLWIIQNRKSQNLKIQELDVDVRQDTDKLIRESLEQINRVEEAKQKFRDEMEKEKIDLSRPKIIDEVDKVEVKPKKSLRQLLEKDVLKRPDEKLHPNKNEKLLLTGIGSSRGTLRGTVKLIKDTKDFNENINNKTILVLKDNFQQIEGKVTLAGAVVSDIGGLTSDVSIICREKGIPCVVGTHIASKVLKNDEEILLDGEIGAIYGIRENTDTLVNIASKKQIEIITPENTETDAPIKTEIKKHKKISATKVFIDLSYGLKSVERSKDIIDTSDGICHIRIEDIYKKIGRHPGAYIQEGRSTEFIRQCANELSGICELANGDPIIIGIGGMTVEEYKKLSRGQAFEKFEDKNISDTSCGLQRLLAKPKELSLAIKIVKRLRNSHGFRNVSLAVEFAGNPHNVIEFKKTVLAEGLRRSSTFKIFLVVDTPSIALIVDQYESAGIDGMIIDIKSLKKLMMSDSYDDPSIIKILDQIKSQLDHGLAIVRFPGKSPAITKKIVESGFYGIAVTRKNLEKTRENVIKLERTIFFK